VTTRLTLNKLGKFKGWKKSGEKNKKQTPKKLGDPRLFIFKVFLYTFQDAIGVVRHSFCSFCDCWFPAILHVLRLHDLRRELSLSRGVPNRITNLLTNKEPDSVADSVTHIFAHESM
jgi:hypothetical protein